MFMATKLQILCGRIDELRLRLEIWISDCGIKDGNLSAITVDEESTLSNVLRALFQKIYFDLRFIFQSIDKLNQYGKQSIGDMRQERYSNP
jgi:hypothetical protein